MKSTFALNHLNFYPSAQSEGVSGVWAKGNLERLVQFIDSNPGCTVVFDADGTIWADDVSEAFFRWLIAGRKLLNVDYESNIYQHYTNLVLNDSIKAYKWIVQVLAGLREEDITKWAYQFFSEHFISRIYQPQKDLIQYLHKRNCDVWIVSASHEWIVKAGAEHFGVHSSNVLGVRLAVRNGVLTDEILEPFTYHEGKIEAIKKYIPNHPDLIFGDSAADIPMLGYAKQMAVFINHAESNQASPLVELAQKSGCLIQYFPLLPPLQFDVCPGHKAHYSV